MISKLGSTPADHVEFTDMDSKTKSEHADDVETLGAEERRLREKKLVRKLDMTLLPIVVGTGKTRSPITHVSY